MGDTSGPRGPESHALPITFSIVGVQKAATSTLYSMLIKHRKIAGTGLKEKHFFDDERMNWDAPNYDWYQTIAKKPHQTLAGDATPSYVYWPQALQRMHAYNPDMLLISTFRDPIERAFSHWSLERGRSPKILGFGPMVRRFRPRSIPDQLPEGRPTKRFQRESIIGRGFYGQQLRRGYEIFDRSQWLPMEFRSVYADNENTLARVTDFLGLPRFKKYPVVGRINQTPDNHSGEPPTAADIADLAQLYAPDLEEFVDLSGLDISGWPTIKILDGSLDPAELAEKLGCRAGLITSSSDSP